MGTINVKYQVLNKALDSFEESIVFFNMVKTATNKQQFVANYDVVYRVARNSAIHCFEFSIELFWKYVGIFLKEVKQVTSVPNTPVDVIRGACQAGVMSEQDAESCINMIRSRNLTSHIYKEDIAEQLMHDIPTYYEQMRRLSAQLNSVASQAEL